MFLKEAIEKIVNDPKISRRENLELKKACENALGSFLTNLVYYTHFRSVKC